MESNGLARVEKTGNVAPIDMIPESAKEYLKASQAENTSRAYRNDWDHFSAWCAGLGKPALPATPETVTEYIADLANTHKPSTIERRIASISKAHQAAGFESPTRTEIVRSTLKGIRRVLGVAPIRKVAVRVNHLRQIMEEFPDNLQGIRDKAILLIGYAGAFRRSELAALNVEDLEFSIEGVKVTLRKSKNDQEGEGQLKGIGYGMQASTCPVKALQAWIQAAGIASGPVFRAINKHGHVADTRISDKAVSLIIKRIAPKFGLNPESVSGHSLRAGFVTDQYKQGTPEGVIMQQTGHKSREVMGIYRREADTFAFNYTAAAGL